jgi:hypothetical protein
MKAKIKKYRTVSDVEREYLPSYEETTNRQLRDSAIFIARQMAVDSLEKIKRQISK